MTVSLFCSILIQSQYWVHITAQLWTPCKY